MNFEAARVVRAAGRARSGLAREAGEVMAEMAETVFLNSVSDAVLRAQTAGLGETESLRHFLGFSRRVCQLLEAE